MTKSLAKNKAWQQRLELKSVHTYPATVAQNSSAFVVDWGNKRQLSAQKYAAQYSLPILRLEDGFVRSLGLGVQGAKSFSMVMDDVGIYYDTRLPSRLENHLNRMPSQPTTLLNDGILCSVTSQRKLVTNENRFKRARYCIDLIVSSEISKYNNLPTYCLDGQSLDRRALGGKKPYRVLVVDQAVGDLSITGAGATADTFHVMLDAALQLHPDAEIILKMHPDAVLGKKHSHFNIETLKRQSVRILDQAVNAISILKQVDEVYVVSSQIGFEALLCKKPVTCFAQPYYAGWGLTCDKKPFPTERRRFNQSLESLFAAAYFYYSIYSHPLDGSACELEDVLEFVGLQRQMYEKNKGLTLCVGLPPWKRAYIKAYLYSPWGSVKFTKCLRNELSVKADRVLFWGDSCTVETRGVLAQQGIEVQQIEDGFIRSVGLGKYYIPPLSLVFDSCGIYYDPRKASNIEKILNNEVFSKEACQRATDLIESIVTAKVSKYNVGNSPLPKILYEAKRKNKKIILLPGQVANDASMLAACAEIKSDEQLINVARSAHPEAFILYKPHPDVVSGNAAAVDLTASSQADAIVTEVSMSDCLEMADEVHTITSLTGFEALLRGVKVVAYGRPFYAGWGLTEDKQPLVNRNMNRSLAELVAAVLIYYPRYMNYQLGCFITPEQALASVIKQKSEPSSVVKTSKVFRFWRKCQNLLASYLYGLSIRYKRMR